MVISIEDTTLLNFPSTEVLYRSSASDLLHLVTWHFSSQQFDSLI